MSYNLRNRLLSYALYWPLSKIYLLACLIHLGKSNLGQGNSVFSLEQEIFSHFKEKMFYFPLRPSYTEWIRFEILSDIKPELSAKFNQIHNRLKASTTLILNFDDASFNKEIANKVPVKTAIGVLPKPISELYHNRNKLITIISIIII